MAKSLMKGNHAIGEAAIRAGCTYFAGYPITPQSEILEYLSSALPAAGGTFVQTESELAAISMVYGAASCGVRAITSSSGPGFSLMQEGISYMASGEVPGVVINVTRYGCGLGDISAAQGDYLQMAKNGGHGDYHCVVLAPGSLQEAVDDVVLAFEIAEKYCNPTLVAVDGSLGSIVEAVDLPEPRVHDKDQFDWAINHTRGDHPKAIGPKHYMEITIPEEEKRTRDKVKAMAENEARWENYMTEDAEIILVSYGSISRICKEAVAKARAQGIKMGLIRPRTLWPFPKAAFEGTKADKYLCVEMCIIPQMAEDVVNTLRGRGAVYSFTSGKDYPKTGDILEAANDALAGRAEEV